ncbi:hypothetical protein BIW11_11447, partial [Tropilaelaps mercedesae]
YFVNHADHTTTWEDPRLRYPQLQNGSYAKYYLYGSGKTTPDSAIKNKMYHDDVISNCPPPYYGMLYYPPPMAPPTYTANVQGSPRDGFYTPAARAMGQYSPFFGSPKSPLRFKSDNKIVVDDKLLAKLVVQFPTVEEGHIFSLLKQYNNRENVAVGALLAEGHPRAQTNPSGHENVPPKLTQIDEALLNKLHSYFPKVDLDYIRSLLHKFNNEEHEVTRVLVSGPESYNIRQPVAHQQSPLVKVRFLKLLFPDADEADIYLVLQNADNNATEAIERLEQQGYKKLEEPQRRPNAVPKEPPVPPKSSELKRANQNPTPSIPDQKKIIDKLKEEYPSIDPPLITMALESASWIEERAKHLLDTVKPTERAPMSSSMQDLLKDMLPPPDGAERPSKLPNELRKADKATATSPEVKPEKAHRVKFFRRIFRFNKATSTHEDQQSPDGSRPAVKGPDPKNMKGPSSRNILRDYMPWFGSNAANRKGPESKNAKGADSKLAKGSDAAKAKGPDASKLQGAKVKTKGSQFSFFKKKDKEKHGNTSANVSSLRVIEVQ